MRRFQQTIRENSLKHYKQIIRESFGDEEGMPEPEPEELVPQIMPKLDKALSDCISLMKKIALALPKDSTRHQLVEICKNWSYFISFKKDFMPLNYVKQAVSLARKFANNDLWNNVSNELHRQPKQDVIAAINQLNSIMAFIIGAIGGQILKEGTPLSANIRDYIQGLRIGNHIIYLKPLGRGQDQKSTIFQMFVEDMAKGKNFLNKTLKMTLPKGAQESHIKAMIYKTYVKLCNASGVEPEIVR